MLRSLRSLPSAIKAAARSKFVLTTGAAKRFNHSNASRSVSRITTVVFLASATTAAYVLKDYQPLHAGFFSDDEKKKAPAKQEEKQEEGHEGVIMTADKGKICNSECDSWDLPVVKAVTTFAPNVPPPIERNYPVRLQVDMETTSKVMQISLSDKYPMWTFGDHVPGPFVRARVGDVMEIRYTNNDATGVGHNIDFHAVTGPGGGAPCLYAEQGETKTARFKLLQPGLFIYHCAAAPVPMHIANGMYGLVLVEPEQGLPKVDKEFYVLQSEFYAEESSDPNGPLEPAYADGIMEHPKYVVFNGREGALTENPLMCKSGERVRVFFGNAGPNLVSSFHIIGAIFDKVYRDADLISPPARGIQTTLVPAGGATVVEFDAIVPGNYTLVDHSIFRLEKGCVGFLKVAAQKGDPRKDVYAPGSMPVPCPGCKLHN